MKNILELTGLRGLAALFIIINHLQLVFPAIRSMSWIRPFQSSAYCGMSLFFILSGFVINYNYADKLHKDTSNGIINFLIARFARLYPLYFVFIFSIIIINLITAKDSAAVNRVLITAPTYLAGMQSWFYGFINDTFIAEAQSYGNISWSISVEFLLYMIYIPLVLCIFKNLSEKKILALLIIGLAGLVTYSLVITSNPIEAIFIKKFGDHTTAGFPKLWTTFYSPYCRFFEFFCGMALAEYYQQIRPRYNPIWLARIILYIGFIGLLVAFFIQFENILFVKIMISISLVFLLFGILNKESKFLSSKPLIFIGDISYSTYLLQGVIYPLFKYNGDKTIFYILHFVGFIACTYLAAYLTYKYFEVPARIYVRNFLTKGFGSGNTENASSNS